MGLDMYLTRKKYIGGKFEFNEVKGNVDISIKGVNIPIDLNKITYIDEEVAYWRKANQIHKWFVDNVQNGEDNCKSYYVKKKQLEELLRICKEVKEKAILKIKRVKFGEDYDENNNLVAVYKDMYVIDNFEEIKNLLPTQEGFFFGSTDYNEWYMQDIEYTIEILEKILKEEEELNKLGFYSEFEYSSSW